ncbi:MAG: hypothetical protein CMH63_00440 [Nanoarchaeota archaeon]|jgi:tRNA G10  N-methylase Trm11|nr:hypothetical protein [Nanoarchaeota archaeon]|tara:strand:- start:20462 stop:21538 length:1077 start_codon:yes stop_codon:yes gene_type:complete
MREYIFILGREPELSFLEIISYFKAQGVTYKVVEYKDEVAIFLLREFDSDILIKRLGGTVKIAEVFMDYKYKGEENRLNWGISVYKGQGKELRNYLTKEFKKENVKAMFRKAREKFFTPSEILAKHLLEFVVYGKYWAKTIAIFEPKWYKERDETRPKQMLLHQVSLRLARILINLSQARANLLDPYCGVGTILQEGLISNLDVVGVDIDEESVKASKKNLEWLKNKYNLKNKFKVIKGDAKGLTRYFKRNSIQGVATEPYLGPYHKKLPTREKVSGEVKNLERLYYGFLVQLRQILRKNGKVAIVFPRLKFHRGSKNLDVKEILKNSGFKVSNIDERVKLPIVSEGKFLDRLIYVLE